MDWEDLLALFLALEHQSSIIGALRFVPDEQRHLLKKIQTLMLIWIEYKHTPTLRLMVIMRVIDDHKVTDPKDRVYALCGLVRDEKVAMLKIDYNVDLRGVYIQTAKYCLSSSQPFLTLSAASTSTLTALTDPNQEQKRCQGLPSWTPDFQFLDTSTPFTGHQYDFRASQDSSPYVCFEGAEDEILVLHGWVNACRTVIGEALPYPTGESIDDIAWRTIICDISSNGTVARPAKQVFGDFYLHTDVNALLRGLPVADDAEIAKYQRLYYQSFLLTTAGLDFFSTDYGSIGWSRPGCQKGDIVFIVSGSNAPFVLRREDGGDYRLVGDSYVHGIMFGEVYDEGKELKRLLSNDFDTFASLG